MTYPTAVSQNIFETIGNTPVIGLRRIVSRGHAQIFGKYEVGNPSYSLKDRMAWAIIGVGIVLKKNFPGVLICAVAPEKSAALSGKDRGVTKIYQIGLGFVPKNLRGDVIERIITVLDRDAYITTRLLARRKGLLLGISTGANVCAAVTVAAELGKGRISDFAPCHS